MQYPPKRHPLNFQATVSVNQEMIPGKRPSWHKGMSNAIRLFVPVFIILLIHSSSFAQNAGIKQVDDCASCHESIHSEWSASMHKKSTTADDILFRKMRQWANKDTNGKAGKLCIRCHEPFAGLSTNLEIGASDALRPVDCVYCHSLADLNHDPVFSDTLFSARDNMESDYHVVKSRDHFGNSKICLHCHGLLVNPKKVEICITGIEYDKSAQAQKNCQQCHMPSKNISGEEAGNNQYSQHAFLGPHNPQFLSGSLKLNAEFSGKDLIVSIDNSKTPHAYPTGSPLRSVILKVKGYDNSGRIVFENWKMNPQKEDPQSVFVRIFEDEQKQFPVPPWRAAAVKSDSRLNPGEIRQLTYQLPVGTVKCEAVIVFRLAPPKILKKLQIDDPYLNQAHLIDKLEISRN